MDGTVDHLKMLSGAFLLGYATTSDLDKGLAHCIGIDVNAMAILG